MKKAVLVLALIAVGASAQDKPKVPVLSSDDKVALLQSQKQLLQVSVQMSNLAQQYQTLQAQQQTLSASMNALVQKAEHDHPGYKLNLDSLEFAAPPEPKKP